jgi:hypothetical protein
MRISVRGVGLLFVSSALLLSPYLTALSLGEDPGDEEDDKPPKEEEKEKPTEREKQVLALFTATQKSFQKGRIVLTYKFENRRNRSPNEELVEDWRPALDQTKMRIRWARGAEGTVTTVEHGILVGDFGEWIHKALFLPDLKMTVEMQSVAQFRPGTILAPTFYSEKKKKALGVTGGYQAVCLSGWKLSKPPFPKQEKPIPTNVRQTVGYSYNGRVLESYLNGKKTSDTSGSPKFTEGFDTGHAGLAWSGSVQSFIYQVTLDGRLDPDWISKQLGEKGDRAGGAGEKGTAAGGKKAGARSGK